jgi:hypothetical protein
LPFYSPCSGPSLPLLPLPPSINKREEEERREKKKKEDE